MKDIFSNQAHLYAQYRPGYPEQLFTFLLSLVPERKNAWDCGTGNGQVAVSLANDFQSVYATDISENQLKNATEKENIFYIVERAEQTMFPDNTFDLITVAQAVHWFNFTKFYSEVKRTLKPNGIIAIIGYSLPRIDAPVDFIIDHFYTSVLVAYWDEERKYIDDHYQTIPFPFNEITTPPFHSLHNWDREHLFGFLNSWSAVQHYINQNKQNPIEQIREEVNACWNAGEQKEVNFPMLLRVGRV